MRPVKHPTAFLNEQEKYFQGVRKLAVLTVIMSPEELQSMYNSMYADEIITTQDDTVYILNEDKFTAFILGFYNGDKDSLIKRLSNADLSNYSFTESPEDTLRKFHVKRSASYVDGEDNYND